MTPLTSIRGYLETLSIPNAVPDAATRDRYVQIVRTARVVGFERTERVNRASGTWEMTDRWKCTPVSGGS